MVIHILNKQKMNNLQKLNTVFITSFEIDESQLDDVAYNTVALWDSVGQMILITNLEEQFDIMIDMEDIMDINSYKAAKSILTEKYNIDFKNV